MNKRTPPRSAESFKVGERVSYWPSKEEHALHFDAVVVSLSPTGRPRIEFDQVNGRVRRTVSARAIGRQETLPL